MSKSKFIALFLIALFITLVFSPFINSLAAISGIDGVFGGRIIATIPCTCSFSTMIIVGPPKGGTFIFTPGISTLYRNYNLFSPHWVLGNTLGKSVCLVGVPPACVPASDLIPIIRKIGTS